MNKYIGHELQLYGVEEMRMVGGKADGMRILNVRNNKGLEFVVVLDRCGDIARLSLKGDNFSYITPCGYVAPSYYDNQGKGFLDSFTAGFMTTCGLTTTGGVSLDDDGNRLPMHGSISNIPCESVNYYIENDEIHIKLKVRDAALFSHHLLLEREYVCPINENVIYLTDKIKNIGPRETPLQVLYHCNMGYPLLSENAKVIIPSTKVEGYGDYANETIEDCLKMETPKRNCEERCYDHTLSGEVCVSIFNSDIGKGLNMKFDTKELKGFTEWKLMGEGEYVLGLEPGNCTPAGRHIEKQKGNLEYIKPEEEKIQHLTFEFVEE